MTRRERVVRVFDRVPSTPDPVRRAGGRYSLETHDPLIGQMPRSYTWGCSVVLDQQSEGACVAHGIVHEAAARPVAVTQWSRPGFESHDPQALAFEGYHWCQRNDEWDGENYSGTSLAAGAKLAVALGTMGEYRWTTSAMVLATAVSRLGPAVIAVNWYTGMIEPDQRNLLAKTGQVEGGHCVLVRGFHYPSMTFRIHNSWGRSWGRDGAALLNFEDMAALLAEQGEAMLPVVRLP